MGGKLRAVAVAFVTAFLVGTAMAAVVLLVMDGFDFPGLVVLVLSVIFVGLLVLSSSTAILARHTRIAGCVALAGVVAAAGVFVWYRSNRTAVVWSAERDSPRAPEAVGAWVVGDVVIRARPDLITAYRITDGARVWTWAPPGRDTVCAVSESTGAGVALVGHAPAGEVCTSTVALDVAFGSVRWSHRSTERDTWQSDRVSASVALAGNAAVVRDGAGWRALSVADGSPLWRADAGEGCAAVHVAAGPSAIVAVSRCGESNWLLSLDPLDGRPRTRTELPVGDGLMDLGVLSVDPVVVWVDEWEERGTRAVLVLDTDGTIRTAIPTVGQDHDLLVGTFNTHHTELFAARPVRAAVVVGDLLVATPVKPGDRHVTSNKGGVSVDYHGRLAAYSLVDGSRVWTSDLDDKVTGITVRDGSVWALTTRKLFQIDPDDGAHGQVLTTYRTDHREPVGLQVRGNRYIVIAESGAGDLPPVRVFKPDFVVR